MMGQDSLTSPHKLLRNRYLYVTKQCRHLPIAMLLVVEQEHIHDLLVALTDSKLRFQVTQIQFRHVKGIASTLPITVSDSKTDTRGQPSNPGRNPRGRSSPGFPGATNTTDEAGTPRSGRAGHLRRGRDLRSLPGQSQRPRRRQTQGANG